MPTWCSCSHWYGKESRNRSNLGSSNMRRSCLRSSSRLVQFAGLCRGEQLVVGQRVVQEVGQPRGEFPVVHRVAVFVRRTFLQVVEIAGSQNADQGRLVSGVELFSGREFAGRQLHIRLDFLVGNRPPPGPLGERLQAGRELSRQVGFALGINRGAPLLHFFGDERAFPLDPVHQQQGIDRPAVFGEQLVGRRTSAGSVLCKLPKMVAFPNILLAFCGSNSPGHSLKIVSAAGIARWVSNSSTIGLSSGVTTSASKTVLTPPFPPPRIVRCGRSPLSPGNPLT